MSTISTLSGENRIILGAGQFARQPLFMQSSSWTKMRIGMRLCMSDAGADATSCSFHVGICHNNSSIFGDAGASPQHFIGANFVGNFNTFVRATSPTRYGCSFVAGEEWLNGVLLVGDGGAGDLEPSTWVIGASDTNRTLMFLDITKNVGGWKLNIFRNTSTSVTDVDKATFDSVVTTESAVLTGHSFAGEQTWGHVDETTNGAFNHVNLSWNHNTPVFKISDLTLVKFF